MKTFKVKFIFFKLYKCVELSAHSASDAEREVCEKYGISQQMKAKCGFKTIFVTK